MVIDAEMGVLLLLSCFLRLLSFQLSESGKFNLAADEFGDRQKSLHTEAKVAISCLRLNF